MNKRFNSSPWLRLAALGLIALLFWLGYALLTQWRMRPADRLTLHQELAQWLHDHSLPTETISAQQTDLLKRLSDRATLALPASAGTRSSDLLKALKGARPDYCVTLNSLAWHGARAHPWFQEHYHPIHQLASPYDSATPLTVFRYTPLPFDAGERRVSQTARFIPGEEERIELTGYRLDTRRVTPGEPLHLTLYWRAVTAIHTPLSLAVRLVDPTTGRVWVQTENLAPGGLETNFWNAGTQLADRYTLLPPSDPAAPDDYALEIAFYARYEAALSILGGGKGEPLRREPVALTQLYRPPDVSTAPPTPDHTLSMTFGDKVELVGYDAPQRIAPGETVRVALYWHARQPVLLNYKVFVHLFTPDGQLLSQDDGLPVHWTYPTTQWQPGEHIRDEHLITLDPATPRGDYVLAVGLYDAATGDHPIVRDAAGNELERHVVLSQIQVR